MVNKCLTDRLNRVVKNFLLEAGGKVQEDLRETGAREKILDAAVYLFSSKGYEKTSMKDIAEEAGVNKALLFYYFSSKENLYRHIIVDMHEKFYRRIESVNEELLQIEDIAERFGMLVKLYIEQFSQTRNIVHIIAHEIVRPDSELIDSIKEVIYKVRQPMVDILSEGMNLGVFRVDDPYFTADAVLGILQIFYRMPICLEPNFNDEEIYKYMMSLVNYGIIKS
jgi:AcrR family transcriptional regulator